MDVCIGSSLCCNFGTSSSRIDNYARLLITTPHALLINRRKPTRANFATGGHERLRTGSPRPLQDTTTCTAVTSCTGSRHPLTSSGGPAHRGLPRYLPLLHPQQYWRSLNPTLVCAAEATRAARRDAELVKHLL